jgi:hypothetical protein
MCALAFLMNLMLLMSLKLLMLWLLMGLEAS